MTRVQGEPSADGKIRCIVWGCGQVGRDLIKTIGLGRTSVRIIGAVDDDPNKAGREIREVYPDEGAGIDVKVSASLDECLGALVEPADVIFHQTESHLSVIQTQLEAGLQAGVNVVAASEIMFHPAMRHAKVAGQLDEVAKKCGVTITGAGVNPGFIFDSWVLATARMAADIEHVTAIRSMNPSGMGPGDNEHVGMGFPVDEFHKRVGEGKIQGHLGFLESLPAVAERLGISIDRVEESWTPITEDHPVDSGGPIGFLEPGTVCGCTQEARGLDGDTERIVFEILMYYEPELYGYEVADEVIIQGVHPVHCKIQPGMKSKLGAAAGMISAAGDILSAESGLHSVLDDPYGGPARANFRYQLDPERPLKPGCMWLAKVPR